MESEGSLPHSQELSSCLYPELDQSSQYPRTITPRFILRLSTHRRRVVVVAHLSSGIPTNNVYAFLFSPICATCPARLIFLDLIILIILGEIQDVSTSLTEGVHQVFGWRGGVNCEVPHLGQVVP
jgi:hypothetical protein